MLIIDMHLLNEQIIYADWVVECGAGFTHNLERMFKDIEMAREENASYRSMREERQITSSIDLTVNVLSASAWPSYPDVSIPFQSVSDESLSKKHRSANHNMSNAPLKHPKIMTVTHVSLRSPSRFLVLSNPPPPASKRTIKVSTQGAA